jgi:hypothetical protein
MDSHQYAAANTAIKQKGVLGGAWIEKSEIGAPGEFDHISDDDVERAIIERFTRLFGPKLAIKDGSITVNGGSDDESF